ncbi:MAG: hypothetical protein P0119_22755 [Nitrospira sp.]|nr:hypothetical protein [Nitrospira sp.]
MHNLWDLCIIEGIGVIEVGLFLGGSAAAIWGGQEIAENHQALSVSLNDAVTTLGDTFLKRQKDQAMLLGLLATAGANKARGTLQDQGGQTASPGGLDPRKGLESVADEVAKYRNFRGGGIHPAQTGKAFSDWFKGNILNNPSAKGREIFEGARRVDILDESDTLIGGRQIYELKNYTNQTSIGRNFWSQADAYIDYAQQNGYTLNYVFGRRISDTVARGLVERGIDVWYIDDVGTMVRWILP